MFEYVKAVFDKNAEHVDYMLTDSQKKKYRKQYLTTIGYALLYSLVYFAGIIGLIYEFFSGRLWVLVLLLIIIRDYVKLYGEFKSDIELIEERIQKRSTKNKKKGHKHNG